MSVRVAALAAILGALVAGAAAAQHFPPGVYQELQWRSVGPPRGPESTPRAGTSRDIAPGGSKAACAGVRGVVSRTKRISSPTWAAGPGSCAGAALSMPSLYVLACANACFKEAADRDAIMEMRGLADSNPTLSQHPASSLVKLALRSSIFRRIVSAG